MKVSFGSILAFLATIFVLFLNFDFSTQLTIHEMEQYKGLLSKRQIFRPYIMKPPKKTTKKIYQAI